jgi:hypothetical protein
LFGSAKSPAGILQPPLFGPEIRHYVISEKDDRTTDFA